MKLHAPDRCPFCGRPLVGGSRYQAYYRCGAHVWIEWNEHWRNWRLKGHPGTCSEKGEPLEEGHGWMRFNIKKLKRWKPKFLIFR